MILQSFSSKGQGDLYQLRPSLDVGEALARACFFGHAPSRPRRLDQTVPYLPPVRRLSMFVASVQASMDVNELGDLCRARKPQTTQ